MSGGRQGEAKPSGERQGEANRAVGGKGRQNRARETNGEVVGGERWSETEGRG